MAKPIKTTYYSRGWDMSPPSCAKYVTRHITGENHSLAITALISMYEIRNLKFVLYHPYPRNSKCFCHTLYEMIKCEQEVRFFLKQSFQTGYEQWNEFYEHYVRIYGVCFHKFPYDVFTKEITDYQF